MGKSPSVPAAPDPAATARAQAQENRITQFLPGGTSLEFGRYTAPNEGDPFRFVNQPGAALRVNEGAFDRGQRLARENVANQLASRAITQVGNLPAAPISFDGLADLPGVGGFGDERRATESALFERSRGLLDPIFKEREEGLRQQLSNRGVPEGGEAFMTEMDLFNRDRSNTYNNAALDAIRAGGSEQSRMFGLASAARNQGLQERQLQRQMSFNELSALLGGQQLNPAVGLQNFVPPAAVDVVGPTNTAYQGQLAGFNAANQSRGGLMGGLFGLGGSAIQGAGAAGGFGALFG